MTIKELYKLAVKCECENKPLLLDYYCNDDWYCYTEPIQSNEIDFTKDNVIITIENY